MTSKGTGSFKYIKYQDFCVPVTPGEHPETRRWPVPQCSSVQSKLEKKGGKCVLFFGQLNIFHLKDSPLKNNSMSSCFLMLKLPSSYKIMVTVHNPLFFLTFYLAEIFN